LGHDGASDGHGLASGLRNEGTSDHSSNGLRGSHGEDLGLRHGHSLRLGLKNDGSKGLRGSRVSEISDCEQLGADRGHQKDQQSGGRLKSCHFEKMLELRIYLKLNSTQLKEGQTNISLSQLPAFRINVRINFFC